MRIASASWRAVKIHAGPNRIKSGQGLIARWQLLGSTSKQPPTQRPSSMARDGKEMATVAKDIALARRYGWAPP